MSEPVDQGGEFSPTEVMGKIAASEADRILSGYPELIGQDVADQIIEAERSREFPTIADKVGDSAASKARDLFARYPDLVDATFVEEIVDEERRRAIEKFEAERAEGKHKSDFSKAPGVRITLTPKGLRTAEEKATEAGVDLEEFEIATVAETELTTITFPRGSYNTYGGVYLNTSSHLNETGRLEEDGQPFCIGGYTGVVTIEGTAAGELWQNVFMEPDGELKMDLLKERGQEWVDAYASEQFPFYVEG